MQKKIMRILLAVVTITFLVFVNSCQDEDPTEPEDQPTGDVTIPATTKIMSEQEFDNSLVSISSDSTTFTFSSGTSSISGIAEDDIVFLPTEHGLLRKVTNVTQSGSQIQIETEQGTLAEAIENGKLTYRVTLSTNQIKKIQYYRDGISLDTTHMKKISGTNFDFNLDQVLYDFDNNQNTTNDQIRLNGNFSLTTDIIIEIDIKWFKLEKVQFGFAAVNSEDLELTGGIEFNFEKEIRIAKINFTPIHLQIGALPVIITPELDLNVGVSGFANSSITTGIENEFSYEAGVLYENGPGWRTYDDFENTFSYTPPTLTANAGARAFVKPEIGMYVYSVLGGYANASLYGELLASTNQDPWWSLYLGVDVGVGARAKALGKELFDFEKSDLLSYRHLLAAASEGPTNEPPDTPSNPNPSNNAIDVSTTTSLSWACSDPEGDPIIYDIYFGTSTYPPLLETNYASTNFDPGALSANTTYYWQITAEDDIGNSTEGNVWSFTTVSNNSPSKKLLYLKYRDPADWTTPNASGSQSIEISHWEENGYEITTLSLDDVTITNQLLSDYEVLRLYSSVQRTFTQNESDAIYNFVLNGGRLMADVPHTSDVDAVSSFGVDDIEGANGGSSGLNWYYHGAPLTISPVSGPINGVSSIACESMDRPRLSGNNLTVDAYHSGYPAIAHGSYGSGKVILIFLTSWSHDKTYPGNAYRANITQADNIEFLQECIRYLK